MIIVKERTKNTSQNTALLYISKNEAEKMGIKWIDEIEGYEITNKQEMVKVMIKIDSELNFGGFNYDIVKTSEEEVERLKRKNINEEIVYTMFISKLNEKDPILKYVDLIMEEYENNPQEQTEKMTVN